tara:strand:- start:21430 stop:24168 length:2739 start_codon:yes stop_codon:yes gene_type:complete
MDRVREHIQLAIGAVALGMLTYSEVADALTSLFEREEPCTVLEFWTQEGHLDEIQIAEARTILKKARTYVAPMENRLDTVLHTPDAMSIAELLIARDSQTSPIVNTMLVNTMMGGPNQSLVKPAPARIKPPTIPAPAQAHADLPKAPPRYQRRKFIGAGGAGQVTETFDRVLKRSVALKSLLKNRKNSLAEETLMAEAQLTASLEHPNIIPVYDAGIDEQGRSFYAMRLIDEPDLEEILCRLNEADEETCKRFTLGRLLRDFMQVCQAVQYANSRGIIHCDLKPQNIVLGPFGEVLVLDWGLAHNVSSNVISRGGTPGYMAPEQLDPEVTSFDARTDVFAMGSILYQILTGEWAFEVETVSDYLKLLHRGSKGEAVVAPPMIRFPDKEIPKELSDICMRALAMNLDDRLGSARELGDAIESFLDRTEDLKRRTSEAKRHIESGDELSERYFEFVESRPEQTEHLLDLRSKIHPWDPVEAKAELWDAEALTNVTTMLRIRTLQAAVTSYEQALELVANQGQARRGLAKLYWAELNDAKQRRDEPNQIYFEGLVRRYDDSGLVDALDAPATLIVSCDEKNPATLRVATLAEQGRRLTVVNERPLPQGDSKISLSSGQYSIRLSHEATEVRFPLRLEPGEEREVSVNTRILTQLDADEVYVPGGDALIAVDPANPASTALYEAHVRAFAIRRFPVTFREYLAFLDDLRSHNIEIGQLIPRDRKGIAYWQWNGRWEPHRMPGSHELAETLKLPAFGVTALAAEQFADWLSEQTGRFYRLPHNREWEKAGRGTDGRRYPWGDHFDALFCKMRDSREGLPTPEPVGTFESDISPYGVRDLAGTIAEWVLPDEGYLGTENEKRYFSRGGAWCDWEIDCGLGRRRIYFARERSARVGFRLLREVSNAVTSRPTPAPKDDA